MAKRDHQPTNERAGSTAPETTDNELLLAQQLAEFALSEADGKLPESLVANLLPEDLEHFVQAREGLAFLNQVSPQKKTSGSVTHGGNAVETVDHSPKADIEDIPTRIGRFEIQSELGRGGFGIVLRARDPRLNRDIALKIPRASSLLQPDLLQRFQREARAAALLSHPGIVPIFETDRIGPVHYIAFEFVDGTTLSQLIRNQQIDRTRTCSKSCHRASRCRSIRPFSRPDSPRPEASQYYGGLPQPVRGRLARTDMAHDLEIRLANHRLWAGGSPKRSGKSDG